jgi:hypothetical protein
MLVVVYSEMYKFGQIQCEDELMEPVPGTLNSFAKFRSVQKVERTENEVSTVQLQDIKG